MLRGHQPGVDLRLTEAEPPEALRMLRAGYVDVAVVFRYSMDAAEGDAPGAVPAPGPGPADHAGAGGPVLAGRPPRAAGAPTSSPS